MRLTRTETVQIRYLTRLPGIKYDLIPYDHLWDVLFRLANTFQYYFLLSGRWKEEKEETKKEETRRREASD